MLAVAVQPGCGQSGMASELEEGLDWVLDRHLAQPEPRKPAVVSMSLLVAANTAAADMIAQKVEELLDAGVVVVAAAGNYHEGAPAAVFCCALLGRDGLGMIWRDHQW